MKLYVCHYQNLVFPVLLDVVMVILGVIAKELAHWPKQIKPQLVQTGYHTIIMANIMTKIY